jgi:succinyl-diaminopimelate desuccinylase
MLLAIKNFIKKNPNHNGTIVMILTSDEEGPAINGVQKLIQNNVLQEYGIDMCLIGEPTSRTTLGDTIKNGRRGSLSGKILIKGQQGHIAYPQNAINPIHQVSPIISELITKKYDEGNEFFPPTSFQISNIHSGIGADNVISNELIFKFNFRYSPKSTKEALMPFNLIGYS